MDTLREVDPELLTRTYNILQCNKMQSNIAHQFLSLYESTSSTEREELPLVQRLGLKRIERELAKERNKKRPVQKRLTDSGWKQKKRFSELILPLVL